jgi:hypothetical protein
MPKGPQGQKRPADTVQAAIMGARIATGEIEETKPAPKTVAEESGSKGGKTRAEKLSPKKRQAIARKAAKARWGAQ